MEHPFLRNEMLWGPEAQARLARAHVLLLGLGGVGSYAAECLARSGVGELTLVDSDTIALTNLNRQAEALESTLGMPKAAAMAERISQINPACRLTVLAEKFRQVGRIEKAHEERYRALLNNVEMQRVFEKSEETMWECRNCGHLVIGKKAPEVCPVCAHPQSYFEVRRENY